MNFMSPMLIDAIMEERLAEAEHRRRVRAVRKQRGLIRRRYRPATGRPVD